PCQKKSAIPLTARTVLMSSPGSTSANTGPCDRLGCSTRCARVGKGIGCSLLFLTSDLGAFQNQSGLICSQRISASAVRRLPVSSISLRYLPSVPPILFAACHSALIALSPAVSLNQSRSRALAPSHGLSMPAIGDALSPYRSTHQSKKFDRWA